MVNAENNLSNLEFVTKLESDFELNKEADLFSRMLVLDANQNQRQRKKDLKANKIDVEKRAKLPHKIFDYIHIASCWKLFFLAWYDNLTYIQSNDSSTPLVALPTTCCNGPSCSSTKSLYTQQELFIDTTTIKITKADQEWIACWTLALKNGESRHLLNYRI